MNFNHKVTGKRLKALENKLLVLNGTRMQDAPEQTVEDYLASLLDAYLDTLVEEDFRDREHEVIRAYREATPIQKAAIVSAIPSELLNQASPLRKEIPVDDPPE